MKARRTIRTEDDLKQDSPLRAGACAFRRNDPGEAYLGACSRFRGRGAPGIEYDRFTTYLSIG